VKQILFIQGAGAGVHDKWDSRLVESLRRELGPGYDIRYPRMPNEAAPKDADWRRTLEKEFAALHSGAAVVGHSVGGAMLIRALAEHLPSVELGAIVLIAAPFIGEGGWDSEDSAPRSEVASRLPSSVPVLLYHGDQDATVPVTHVALYAKTIRHAQVRRLPGRDHQLNDDLSEVARDIRELMDARSA
jgi:predicted alpha/beta hydrolase family esterase